MALLALVSNLTLFTLPSTPLPCPPPLFFERDKHFPVKGLCVSQDPSLIPPTPCLIFMCQLKCQAPGEDFSVYPVEAAAPLYLVASLPQHFSCVCRTILHNLKLILLTLSFPVFLQQ